MRTLTDLKSRARRVERQRYRKNFPALLHTPRGDHPSVATIAAGQSKRFAAEEPKILANLIQVQRRRPKRDAEATRPQFSSSYSMLRRRPSPRGRSASESKHRIPKRILAPSSRLSWRQPRRARRPNRRRDSRRLRRSTAKTSPNCEIARETAIGDRALRPRSSNHQAIRTVLSNYGGGLTRRPRRRWALSNRDLNFGHSVAFKSSSRSGSRPKSRKYSRTSSKFSVA
jgi:hypothetical protein